MKRHADIEPWAYSDPESKSRNSVKGVLTRMLLGIGLGLIEDLEAGRPLAECSYAYRL